MIAEYADDIFVYTGKAKLTPEEKKRMKELNERAEKEWILEAEELKKMLKQS
ncbi:MAG: hypothetical protein LBU81_03880 [Methanosarcinales archaeon]|jgi:hypothetical protein|nr:hypothetical protein [Methanosarcinales archaeon]